MKKKYKILLIILGAEFLILSVLSKLGLKVESEIGNAVGRPFCFDETVSTESDQTVRCGRASPCPAGFGAPLKGSE